MKKSLTLLLIVFTSILLAGLYGILHDQITYTISPEYYTKFKFIQFGVLDRYSEAPIDNPRVLVAKVGFLATWWVGFWIGLVLGLVSLIHSDWKLMWYYASRAMVCTVVIALLTGFVGLFYGFKVLAKRPESDFTYWFIPENLTNFKDYIAVGSMHNFSYLGGLIGLLFGVGYIIWGNNSKRRMKTITVNTEHSTN